MQQEQRDNMKKIILILTTIVCANLHAQTIRLGNNFVKYEYIYGVGYTALDNYLITEDARLEIASRIDNGYVAGTGFVDDFQLVKDSLSAFTGDPTRFRPIYGENPIYKKERQILYHTALYAYAKDDFTLSNTIATEILATVNSNDLYTTYLNDLTDLIDMNSYMIQLASAKKMKDSYYFIKKLQTVLVVNLALD